MERAEATFRHAMKLACSYGSRALEVRAAATLVRLLREQGRHDEAAAVRQSLRHAGPPA